MDTHANSINLGIKSIEKVLDESQHSCEINLSGRKLHKFPEIALHFDLNDVILADLSKNCLTELPDFLCNYISIEEINCCSNNIRFFPLALTNLQNLVSLNLSKNQLSVIPPFLCQLSSLEILRISNNKLSALPDSIGNLLQLKELDVNYNYLAHLPEQICKLHNLKCLYAKRNRLIKLPLGLHQLELTHIDISINRITHVPLEYCKFASTLDYFNIEHNPLIVPPTDIVIKGKQHILYHLKSEYRKFHFQQSMKTLQTYKDRSIDEGFVIKIEAKQIQSCKNTNSFEDSLNEIEKFVDERDTPEGGNSTDNSPRSISPSCDLQILKNQELEISKSLSLNQNSSKLGQSTMDELDLKHIGFIVNSDNEDNALYLNGHSNGFSERSSSPSIDSPPIQETDEFRSRHRNLSQRRKQEAQLIKQMLQQQKQCNNDTSKFSFTNESVNLVEGNNTISPLSAGCLKALEVISNEIESGNPVFTIRRNMHHVAFERESTERLKEILKTHLNINLSTENPLYELRDGIILCQLANHISPNSVPNIYTPLPSKARLSESKCRKNIDSFLLACRKAGISDDRICCDNVILECSDMISLCDMICLFIDISKNYKQSAV